MHRLSARTTWYAYEAGASFLGMLAFTVTAVYYVTEVGMSPLQLVLVGTLMEVSIFVFEVPTGIVADIYSRRLSIVDRHVRDGHRGDAVRRPRRRVADPRRERALGLRLHVHERRLRCLARRRGRPGAPGGRLPARRPGRPRRGARRDRRERRPGASSTSGCRSSSPAPGRSLLALFLALDDARDRLLAAAARGARLVRPDGAHREGRASGSSGPGRPCSRSSGSRPSRACGARATTGSGRRTSSATSACLRSAASTPSSGSASSAPARSCSRSRSPRPLGKRIERAGLETMARTLFWLDASLLVSALVFGLAGQFWLALAAYFAVGLARNVAQADLPDLAQPQRRGVGCPGDRALDHEPGRRRRPVDGRAGDRADRQRVLDSRRALCRSRSAWRPRSRSTAGRPGTTERRRCSSRSAGFGACERTQPTAAPC